MTDLKKIIQDVVFQLQDGKTILYPTDTIWGIGCDALNSAAIQKIFEIKKRPDKKSVLLLASSLEMIDFYVNTIPDVVPDIINAENRPLTIIYPGAKNLPDELIGEDGSIGIRLTRDEFCLDLITQLGKPLVSTSANFSGSPYPVSFEDIDPLLVKQVDYVIPWRQQDKSLNIPSKIIKIEPSGGLTVIRE